MTMTVDNLVSLDTLKLQLIRTPNVQDSVSFEELVEYLMESLEDADKATANRAENLLVRMGAQVIPHLVKGLKSPNNTLKSVCAMALIRIGQPSVEALKELYIRSASRPQSKKHKWVVAFVLTELGEVLPETMPAVETVEMDELPPVMQQSSTVRELSKVG